MLNKQVFQIAAIYVPRTLDAEKVGQIAGSILEDGQVAPSGCEPTAIDSFWWQAFTGWKP